MTTLDSILNKMTASTAAVTEKSASADTTGSDVEARLMATVASLSKTASDKESGAVLPTLDKMAAATAAVEADHMLATAKLAGVAMCDGFISRLAAYDAHVGTKTASASELEAAYVAGAQAYEKQASDAFQQAHDETMQEIHKIAADIHFAGQQSARNVVIALRQGA